MEILDLECAKHGSEIASIQDNSETLITKSLGVLQEDGIYASCIYLLSRGRKEEKPALKITQVMFKFLKESEIFKDNPTLKGIDSTKIDTFTKDEKNIYVNSLLSTIQADIASNLNGLLLAKELLERTLVYARYHAKALGSNSNEEGA